MKKTKLLTLTACILMITAGIVYAADRPLHVIGDEDLILSSTAQHLPDIPTECDGAMISIQGDDVRFKLSDTVEADNGAILNEGDILILDSISQIIGFNVILDSGSSSATAYVTYFGKR